MKNFFPIFKNNKEIIFLDSAASYQKPQVVIDAEKDFYEKYYSSIGRGNCLHSQKSTELYENSREKIANFFGTKKENIAFVRGATEGFSVIANGVKKFLKKGDKVLVSKLEHNSNILPWLRLKKEIGIELVFIEPDKNFEINLEKIEEVFDEKVKICSLTHVSNFTGQILDIKKISRFFKEKEVLFFLDACQSAVHMKLEIDKLDISGLSLSAHKIGGPTGIGILYLNDEMMEKVEPLILGGGSISSVEKDGYKLLKTMQKFESGSESSAQVYGFGKAVEFFENIGFEKIKEIESELLEYSTKELKKITGLKIVGENIKDKVGIISFYFEKIHCHDVGEVLAKYNICLRTGKFCTDLAHDCLNIPGSSRISFSIFNTKKDVDVLIKSLKEVLKIF